MAEVIHSPIELQEIMGRERIRQKSIGFVPTMGALHRGHASLLQRARQENEITVLSIFVNPTQFNDKNDFEKYPTPFQADLQVAVDNSVDYVFLPSYQDMYPDNFKYKVMESELSAKYCGAFRPGHFEGMLTVVLKLLQVVMAHRAYFGLKDYQQYELVKGMAAAFFLGTEIVGCEVVREPSGLALSSRNVHLSPEGKAHAAKFYEILNSKISKDVVRALLEQNGFEVEYVEDYRSRRLAAIRFEGVRLIDNVEI